MPGSEITEGADLTGKKLIGRDGVDLGDVQETSSDGRTDRPEFAQINTGLLGRKSTLVPLSGATVDDVRVWVDVDKETVKDAPTIDPGDEISDEQRQAIYSHYGLEGEGSPPQGETAEAAAADSSGESRPDSQAQPSPDAEAGQPGTAAPPEQPADRADAPPAPVQDAPAAGERAYAEDPGRQPDDPGPAPRR